MMVELHDPATGGGTQATLTATLIRATGVIDAARW